LKQAVVTGVAQIEVVGTAPLATFLSEQKALVAIYISSDDIFMHA
jgi:hypothetical protein